MFTETTSLGLDVHARSVAAAAIDGSTGEVIHRKLANDLVEISGFVEELTRTHGELRITYEAGPTGFGLARALQEAGHLVQVAAPSKLIRPPGDRVRPTATMRCCWPAWTGPETSSPSASPPAVRNQLGIWSAPAMMPAGT